jgi:hypothetical protein
VSSLRVQAVVGLLFVLSLALVGPGAAPAAAEEPVWRSEQPRPAGSAWPIGLGAVGDMEFIAPNRGLLITAGNPPTVPPGVWAYDGVEWHELASVCGASDGRIAWAGPEEFWTVSDGRPGQTSESSEFLEPPPLQDNTLCHFAGGQVVGSYAHPAFQADSYQAMHAAACYGPSDCWYGGDPLPAPQIGAFQLHWGGTLEAEPYPAEGHAIEDMLAFEGLLYESAGISHGDAVAGEVPEPPVLRRINRSGIQPSFQEEPLVPLYGPNELPEALAALRLSGADGALWAAAGGKRAEAGEAGQVTVVRRAEGVWSQLFGATSQPLPAVLPAERQAEEAQMLGGAARDAAVSSIAAEPETDSVWLALKAREPSGAPTRGVLVRVSSQGQLREEQTLPSDREVEEGVGPKGAIAKVTCPQAEDCWAVTTQGWLFHLAPDGQRQLARDRDPYFAGPITVRPPDQGLPQIPPDAPPVDTSGLVEASPFYGGSFKEPPAEAESRVSVPLLSRLRSRLIHGTTLQLSFHLAAKARVRLLAKRKRAVVAKTPMRTLSAGNRKLVLRLDPRRWPTKLQFQTHALAPLPTVSTRGAAVGTVSTGFFALPRTSPPSGPGALP